jgi:hypothetical protein
MIEYQLKAQVSASMFSQGLKVKEIWKSKTNLKKTCDLMANPGVG